ncbi:C-type lectin domain-containing protein 141-like [Drosophila novamexicana]|uniref:C-type lectin domain-containing protein 141-like n=1 Tax=Drosophila novamexicana TaxID=47314 RepID=UPI0011E59E72|nr:C-type lectin domain-containing protein 141-like [Drosophila novamexicana]
MKYFVVFALMALAFIQVVSAQSTTAAPTTTTVAPTTTTVAPTTTAAPTTTTVAPTTTTVAPTTTTVAPTTTTHAPTIAPTPKLKRCWRGNNWCNLIIRPTYPQRRMKCKSFFGRVKCFYY